MLATVAAAFVIAGCSASPPVNRIPHDGPAGLPSHSPYPSLKRQIDALLPDSLFPPSNAAIIITSLTTGDTLYDLMAANGWKGAKAWRKQANEIAPTVVGGSHKHGGPDLGPTRARKAWATLGVDGLGIANEAPERDFVGMPRLTVRMVARIQGFPDEWQFAGGKTQSYRQVGNAFPSPFARAVAEKLKACLTAARLFKMAG